MLQLVWINQMVYWEGYQLSTFKFWRWPVLNWLLLDFRISYCLCTDTNRLTSRYKHISMLLTTILQCHPFRSEIENPCLVHYKFACIIHIHLNWYFLQGPKCFSQDALQDQRVNPYGWKETGVTIHFISSSTTDYFFLVSEQICNQ